MKIRLIIIVICIGAVSFSCEDILDLEDTGDPRDKIVDVWTCIENSQIFKSTTGSYTVEISKDQADSTKLIIENFYNLNREKYIKASLSGKSLAISNQNIEGFIFNGSGTITNNYNKIEWTYKVELPDGDIDNVTAVYERL